MDRISFTANMYVLHAGAAVIRQNIGLLLFVYSLSILTTVAAEWIGAGAFDNTLFFLLGYLMWMMAATATYSTLLLGVAGVRALTVPLVLSVCWRDLVLRFALAMPVAIAALAGTVFIDLPFMSSDDNLFSVVTGSQEGAVVMIVYLSATFVFLVALAFLGTWQAAVVAGGNRRLGAAFIRGKSGALKTLGQLLLWVGPVVVASVFVFGRADLQAERLVVGGGIRWTALSNELALTALELLSIVLTAVVISLVYARAEGDETA